MRVLFWTDIWAGNSSLASQFSSLFACARERQVKVCDYMVQNSHVTSVINIISFWPKCSKNISSVLIPNQNTHL